MSVPKLSIITPVYNAESVLAATIDSVVAQDLGDIEYIVVDDGSSDGSKRIIAEYARRFPWIRTAAIENSGSGARPRNIGLDMAAGEYVFFLDADDLLAPEAARRMCEVADETDSDVVLCRMENFGEGTRSIPRAVFRQERRAEDFIESMAYRTLGPTKLYRRALIEANQIRFPEGYRVGEDQPFTLRAFLLGNHISAISDRVYYWVRNYARGGAAVSASMGGQPVADDLTKNLNCIDVIRDLTEPGVRRDILVERFVLGDFGLRVCFGPRFLRLPRREQRALVERAGEAADMWSVGLQRRTDHRLSTLLSAVFSGNGRAVVNVASRSLGNAWVLAAHHARGRTTTLYVQGVGGRLEAQWRRRAAVVETVQLTSDVHQAVVPHRIDVDDLVVNFVGA